MCEHKTKAVRLLQARFLLECFCAECGISISTLSKQDAYRDPQALERWAGENDLNVDLVRGLAG